MAQFLRRLNQILVDMRVSSLRRIVPNVVSFLKVIFNHACPELIRYISVLELHARVTEMPLRMQLLIRFKAMIEQPSELNWGSSSGSSRVPFVVGMLR